RAPSRHAPAASCEAFDHRAHARLVGEREAARRAGVLDLLLRTTTAGDKPRDTERELRGARVDLSRRRQPLEQGLDRLLHLRAVHRMRAGDAEAKERYERRG